MVDVDRPKADLEKLINDITVIIFKADQCIFINTKIGAESENLNGNNFGDLFGSIQGLLDEHLILGMTKIFERPNPRFETVSLPAILDYIEKHANDLTIVEPILLDQALQRHGVQPDELNGLDDQAKTQLMVGVLRREIPSDGDTAELRDALEALRTNRNKKIAHHELVPIKELPAATLGQIQSLLDIAKTAVGVIGNAYLSTAFTDNEDRYIMTSDAERASVALERLFRIAGLSSDK